MPRLKACGLQAVFRIRDRILEAVEDLIEHPVDVPLTSTVIVDAVESPSLVYEAVAESLAVYSGRVLDRKEWADISWRLAGNVDRLRMGSAVYPWSRQDHDEWVPFQVLQVSKKSSASGKPGILLTCRALAGTPCPMRTQVFWTVRLARYLSTQLGFTKKLPIQSMLELSRLRFWGLVLAEKSNRRGSPWFRDIRVTASLKSHNASIIRSRRRSSMPCPRGYQHDCHLCPVGYRSCSAGTHPYDYRKIQCIICGEESWHDGDPSGPGQVCMRCR